MQNGRWTCQNLANTIQNGRWTCPHVGNPMQNGRWTCQNVANTIQNGRWTCPHVVNPMQNGRWTCPNVSNTMQNDKFKFQTVANTRQMVPAKKSKKKNPKPAQKKILKLFHTPFIYPSLRSELQSQVANYLLRMILQIHWGRTWLSLQVYWTLLSPCYLLHSHYIPIMFIWIHIL